MFGDDRLDCPLTMFLVLHEWMRQPTTPPAKSPDIDLSFASLRYSTVGAGRRRARRDIHTVTSLTGPAQTVEPPLCAALSVDRMTQS